MTWRCPSNNNNNNNNNNNKTTTAIPPCAVRSDNYVFVGTQERDLRGRRHHRVQTARASTPNDAIVTILTPLSPPAVPNLPIFFPAISTKGNDGHTMVEGSWTAKNPPRMRDTAAI